MTFSFKFIGEDMIEKTAEKLADGFKVNQGQPQLSRDEKNLIADVFHTALFEIRQNSNSVAKDSSICGINGDDFRIIANFAEDMARRLIGHDRANYWENVNIPLENTMREWDKVAYKKEPEIEM